MRIPGQKSLNPTILIQVVVQTLNQVPHQAQNQVDLNPTQTLHQNQTHLPPQSHPVKRKSRKSENTHLTANHEKTTNAAAHPAKIENVSDRAHVVARETAGEEDRVLPLITAQLIWRKTNI